MEYKEWFLKHIFIETIHYVLLASRNSLESVRYDLFIAHTIIQLLRATQSLVSPIERFNLATCVKQTAEQIFFLFDSNQRNKYQMEN